MNKQQAYIAALELAIRALDSAFVRANAAEVVRPSQSLSARWQLSEAERDAAERAELAAYDVTADHWGARLALMSAFEALHAALRVIASSSAHDNPQASAWREATARSQEASRLAHEAALVLYEASLPPRLPRATEAAELAAAQESATALIAQARATADAAANSAFMRLR